MNPSELGTPPSVESGAAPTSSPGAGGPTPPSKDVAQAHYRSSDSECFQCEHFDGNSVCKLGVNGGQTEPGAGCDLFDMKGEDDQDGDEGGGAPMPGGGQGAPPQSMPPQGGAQ
ncbi:MAG: hypothetical protein M3O20_13745 [Acidobacteriota bacterium]|nr:hypothetical protein [Acidobacteriota bacterium]